MECRYCGIEGKYDDCAVSNDWPALWLCVRRQLAAANERAGRYKEALADIKTNHQHAEYVYDRATMALEVPDAL